MSTKLHTTVSGHRVEYDPSSKVDAFLRRLERMVDDETVSEQDMIGVAYSGDNPILAHDVFPGRGAVTKAVLDDPTYAVMTDLLFRKRIAQESIDVEKLAARYSMTVPEAAEQLGVHESAVRQAIGAKRLASWMKDGRHYLEPKSLDSFEVGTRGPRGSVAQGAAGPRTKSVTHGTRGPRAKSGGPLEIVMGHAKDLSLKVRSSEPVEPVERVEGNIVKGALEHWKRVVVMTTGVGGSKRAFVLEPAAEDNEVTFGPFSVRGRFVVAEKANAAKKAEQIWKDGEVS